MAHFFRMVGTVAVLKKYDTSVLEVIINAIGGNQRGHCQIADGLLIFPFSITLTTRMLTETAFILSSTFLRMVTYSFLPTVTPSFSIIDETRFRKVEVMVCGVAASGAYEAAERGTFLKALTFYGHIPITNGEKRDCAGWKNAATLQPYLYNPKKTLGRRFSVLKSTKIARMYHSSALLLPDGRVLVAGGNPNNRYTFRNVSHPTELRLQTFILIYMDRQYHHLRPGNVPIEYIVAIHIALHMEKSSQFSSGWEEGLVRKWNIVSMHRHSRRIPFQ
ncbi:hypothetical protein CRYUN_Cryun12cG0167100 [Craigia yunnanensis]